jgi:large subunit ribosomal protein L23
MNQERLLNVLRAPLVSEKTARIQGLNNQYVFEVATTATRIEVKAAVEELFKVKVLSVQVLNVMGKTKSFRFRTGKRQDWRKAYVRLEAGQTIDLGAQA